MFHDHNILWWVFKKARDFQKVERFLYHILWYTLLSVMMKKNFKKMFKLILNALKSGYLRGSVINRSLPTIYDGVVLEEIGNTLKRKFSKYKHLQERKRNACEIPEIVLYYI